ncbi:MAG: HD domain-containing protein [Elusimicrobia bacterium]|nr:HD domain-containing protein [Elusimicrobiota bacterium]
MRTLVFGGSFDPPHRGHAKLLAAAAEKIRPDRILIVPAYRAPLKNRAPAATAEERLALVRVGLAQRLASRWRRKTQVEDGEVRARRCVFTVETLARLKGQDPAGELHFVCGADAAATFPRWKDPARLRALASWWYGARPGAAGAAPAFFRRVPGRFPDISSTELRAALELGQDEGPAQLFAETLAEIKRRGLYGQARLARLSATLKPGRFAHTLNVAALADALARRHGVDAARARLAGLLHDAGRRFSSPELAAYVRRRRLRVPFGAQTAARTPMLLHAYVSEDLARREFGVRDAAVLRAVRRHTLGGPRMSVLDKVLYVADACSADRRHPGVERTRALAFDDLDAAFARCVVEKLSHALARRAWIHPATVALWNSLAAR